MGRAAAASTLRAAELIPRFTGASGLLTEVAVQSPAAGTSVDRGTTVTLEMRET
jgi:beta-lactam-binding protein with PASTA domain